MTPDTITLQPGSIYPVRVEGKYVTIVSCSAALSVELDDGGRANAVAGSQFGSDKGFSKITFVETSGVVNTVTYTVSNTPSPGRATVVQALAATFTGPNSGSYALPYGLGAKLFIGFPGVDAQGRSRKVMYVTNTGNTAINLYTLTWPTIVSVIQPSTNPVPFETSDTITIGVNSGAGSFSIFEVFYSKPLQTDQ